MCPTSAREVAACALAVSGALLGGCGRVGYELEVGPSLGGDRGGGAATHGDGGAASSSDASGSGIGGTTARGGDSNGSGGAGGSPVGVGGASGTGDAAIATGGTTSDASLGAGGMTADAATSSGGTPGTGGITSADAGAGCVAASYGGHDYAFCKNALPYDGAETSCESRGMRLARVDDGLENQFIGALALPFGTSNSATVWPWVGARDYTNPIEWKYSDGTVFWNGAKGGTLVPGTYANWTSASPGDTTGTMCAVMQNTAAHKWSDQLCTLAQPYVCEAY